MADATAKVCVLLSCYNGGDYLREQIDSILGQTWRNTEILARDDGSSDKTPSLLAEYAARPANGGPVVRYIDDGKHLGYPECFYALMRLAADAEYIAFSDQDDVWLPEKLERAVHALAAKGGPGKPMLYFCASEQCDEHMIAKKVRRAPDEIHLPGCSLLGSIAPGFAIVITRALADVVLPRVDGTAVHHDRMLCRAAAYLGEILADPGVYAKHRLHALSHTALHRGESGDAAAREDAVWRALRKENIEFFARFHDLLGPEARREVDRFANGGRWGRVFYPKRLRRGLGSELRLRRRFVRESKL